MKLHKMSLVAGLVLSGLIACGSMAMAQDQKAGKEGRKGGFPTVQERLDRMTEALKLTDEQKPKVKAALEEQSEAMKALRDATPEERREKGKGLREEFDKKMKAILTSEQYEKFQSMPRGGPGGRKKGDGEKKADGDKKE
jgi:Spy/CpxP family protein refolding chaperone